MKQEAEKRKQEAKEGGMKVGIGMSWRPGNSLPQKSIGQAMKSKEKETVIFTEALFADDAALYGERVEMKEGRKIVKRSMKNFEEQCHEGKEEHLVLGKSAGGEIECLEQGLAGSKMCSEEQKRMMCSHDHQEEIEKHHTNQKDTTTDSTNGSGINHAFQQ